ncbi:HdeD family acid-resistance protein [Paraburkholderia sp. GAS334]|uniref:HdeD family acid-resistance protein n=1 Tax=Paraburkholderia sp. GAS334 TaxID=3035131 RepID=UPI003D237DF2
MVRLVMILLGVDYLRTRWRPLMMMGWISVIVGVVVFIDALDNALYFPITPFALLLLLEGLATLAVAWTGMGGQRTLRYVKGTAFSVAALLILAGHHHGNFILSMIFGTLFLADGLLQIVSAKVVRYRTWRLAIAGGIVEIALAIFFYQPFPTWYVGTVPYCLGLGLVFAGWNMILLASRVRRLAANPAVEREAAAQVASATPVERQKHRVVEWDGPPAPDEPALTVHVWTPVGSSKSEARRQLIVDRYIAAVDRNGVISTGHAALESPEGIYISLYPGVEIDRSPDDFTRILRATPENDVPGVFQPDYATESKAWCPSTIQVRIRNYDPERLRRFWQAYRQDATYNLTHRNCSSTVSRALEAAIEGASARVWHRKGGWRPFVRVLTTPELWVAAQIRKRATTMAWTPGLTLDYARALSMLADPRPSGWVKMARLALQKMYRSRQQWREEEKAAADGRSADPASTAGSEV